MPPEVYGPRWAQRLGEALSSLRLLGGRAGLALLGIAVGCAAVVALLNVGHSAAMHSQQVFQGMGSELMIATLSATADTEEGPAQALVLTALPAAIRAAAPLAMASAEARLGGRSEALLAVGSSAALATVLGLSARHGRLFVEQDGHSPHVLLGATAARQLEANVGDRLQVGRYLFEVIGVLAPHGYNPMLPVAVDDALLMPLAGMRRLASAAQVSAVLALARDAASLPDAAAALGDYLRAQLPRMASAR
ncbi:ABC-type antimicrobial peptide transport system permease subunit [Pseudomonas hunanensis]|uniref:ABC-type antimicrobial peptide transport system permease subunit n=1 Tax=Pseudomonas hunanensis TaxID=1247546 RepID=A0ACC6K2P8_9PSED|nr:ABC transporter permease [Pseudomonas hunanensis]MDR6712729.1 ABC-type antimicrobial peptide transport system permease subunit [Pseudomonas hunanensis]